MVKILGALPLLLPLFQRLGLREIVNRHRDPCAAEHDCGPAVLLLCLNRLLAPQPLVHVERWLQGTALPEILGITADEFNDDRLARVLDALALHLEGISGAAEVDGRYLLVTNDWTLAADEMRRLHRC